MAKIPVRIVQPFKGLNVGAETTMSIGRARDAVATGRVEYMDAPKKTARKTAAKKAPAKRVAKKTATKTVAGTRNRSMRGKTSTK